MEGHRKCGYGRMRVASYYKFFFLIIIMGLASQCQKNNSLIGRQSVLRPDTTSAVRQDTGVCIGNSIVAGHPWRFSALELGSPYYHDSAGQITWFLTQLTGFPWINQGWGGQTTTQIRKRFLRDAIGLHSDAGDGRGPVTLGHKPDYIVIEGGINDIQQHVSLDTIKANLSWMAATCQQYSIPCMVMNCVGYGWGVIDQDQTQMIFDLNDWLAKGALNGYEATIVDINTLWNSGSYQGVSAFDNDNIHFSDLVDSQDGVHFTQAGYDSIANIIYRVAKLP